MFKNIRDLHSTSVEKLKGFRGGNKHNITNFIKQEYQEGSERVTKNRNSTMGLYSLKNIIIMIDYD